MRVDGLLIRMNDTRIYHEVHKNPADTVKISFNPPFRAYNNIILTLFSLSL